jgi:hypothetical protein
MGESERTDNKIRTKLNNKLRLLNYDYSVYGNVNKEDIEDETKLYMVLSYLEDNGDFIEISSDKIADQLTEDYILIGEEGNYDRYDVNSDGNYYYINHSTVKEEYKNIFGEDLSVLKAAEYSYEPNVDAFFAAPVWRGNCDQHLYSSITKYSEDKEYAYIYLIAGFANECVGGVYKTPEEINNCEYDEDGNSKCNILSEQETFDFDDGIIAKEDIIKNHADELNKYRFVFKKNGDNFIFEKVEVI